MEHTGFRPIQLFSPVLAAMNTLDDFIRSVSRWQTLLADLDGKIALPQIRTSEVEEPLQGADPAESDAIINIEDLHPQCNDPALNYPTLETKDTITRPHQPETAPALLHPPTTTSKLLHHKSAECLASSSQPSNSPNPQISHKRKASSAGKKSDSSKYRIRTMIHVQYDSRVQTAFMSIVQFLSMCRNIMRKERNAAMTRTFKKLGQEEDDAENCELLEKEETSGTRQRDLRGLKHPVLQIDAEYSNATTPTSVAHSTPIATEGRNIPRMNFLALRTMNRGTSAKSIYEELDSELEWCQSVCEKAAYQNLRDGTIEIEGLKKRFAEIIELAEGIAQSTQK